MKKTVPFLFLILSLVFNKTGIAQKLIIISAKAGVNISNMKPDTLSSENKYNFSAGIAAQIISLKIDKSTLFFELNYTPLGYKQNENEIDLTYKYNYLNFTSRIRFYIFSYSHKTSGIFLSGGPYISYLLFAEKKGEIAGKEINENIKSSSNLFDSGLSFGAGISHKGVLSIEYNYNFGLVPVNPNSINIFHRTHLISIRFSFAGFGNFF